MRHRNSTFPIITVGDGCVFHCWGISVVCFSQLWFFFPCPKKRGTALDSASLRKSVRFLRQGRKFMYMCVCVYMCVDVFKEQWHSLCRDTKSADFDVWKLSSSSVFSVSGLIEERTSPCALCLAYILRPCQLWQKLLFLYLKREQKCKAVCSLKQSICNCVLAFLTLLNV